MSGYEFQSQFHQRFHQKSKASRIAVLVGIRIQKSLNRYTIVIGTETFSKLGTVTHSKRTFPNVFNFKSIYYWIFKVVWIAISKFNMD